MTMPTDRSPTARFANLELDDQDPFPPDATSPNAMMVDPPEELDLDRPENNDVQLIDVDQAQPGVPPKSVATDCRFSVASSRRPDVPMCARELR